MSRTYMRVCQKVERFQYINKYRGVVYIWSHYCLQRTFIHVKKRFPPPLSISRTLLLVFYTKHFAVLCLRFNYHTVLRFSIISLCSISLIRTYVSCLLFRYDIFHFLSNVLSTNFDSIHCSHSVKVIDILDYSDSLLV